MRESKIPILFWRELDAIFSSPVAYVVVVLFLLISGALFWLPYFQQVSALDLRAFFSQAPLFLCFFIPAMTMGSLSGEARAGTLQLLMTLPMSELELVVAKFLATLSLLVVVFLMTLCYPITLSMLGAQHGVSFDWGAVAAGYVGLMLLGSAYTGIGLMASSWTRDQVVAVLIAFSLCFALYLLEQLAAQADAASTWRLIAHLSTSHHFRDISRGVIASSDVVYYLSLTALSLGVARASLRARRFVPSR